MSRCLVATAVATALTCLGARAVPPAPTDIHDQYPGVRARFDRVDRLFIGGQPDEATLRRLAADGVTTVVNLRTPAEMADHDRVPFDEAGVLAELNLRSILVPIGNMPEYPYRPEAIDAIRDALASTDGLVLLHCQSGWRTAWTYGGYLVREHGVTLDEAMAAIESLVDDSSEPLDNLLGVTTALRFADEAASESGAGPSTHAQVPSYAVVPASGLNTMPIEPPTAVTGFEPAIEARHFRVGPLDIAGQPSEAAFRQWAAEGVTVIINLRTQQEMDNRDYVSFDEAALLTELGIDYVHIPLGTNDPYTPVAVDAFARALAGHEGRAVLHCTVAWRASLMWGAYLARHRGLDINEAVAHASAIVPATPPLEGLLGRRIVRVVEARR